MGVALIDWKGSEVREHVVEAARIGIDETMADAVRKARANHPHYPPASAPGERYASRTGDNVADITIKVPASHDGLHIRGVWGSTNHLSLYLEIGTSRKASGFPRAQERAAAAGGDMWAVPPPSEPPQMAARYTLRPAASMAYKLLPVRMGIAFRGEEML